MSLNEKTSNLIDTTNNINLTKDALLRLRIETHLRDLQVTLGSVNDGKRFTALDPKLRRKLIGVRSCLGNVMKKLRRIDRDRYQVSDTN